MKGRNPMSNTKQMLMNVIVTDIYGTRNSYKGAVQNTYEIRIIIRIKVPT